MLTQAELKNWLNYDLQTGVFTWAKSRVHGKVKVGRRAGCLHPDGYYKIRLLNKLYRCSRLAVLYMLGELPEFVDHVDLDRSNDRWENIRVCTKSQNQMNQSIQSNNKCGFKGVFWNKQRCKYQAKIGYDRIQKHLGFFSSAEEAHQAYVTAAKIFHGEFARTE